MYRTVTTYFLQRFSFMVWAGSSIFLLFYSTPSLSTESVYLLLFLVPAIFVFRLFDDLLSREADAGKENRIYTGVAEHRLLTWFLLVISALLFFLLLFLQSLTAWLLLSFFILTAILYPIFTGTSFRTLIPLLKYPFFCFLLMIGLNGAALPGRFELFVALSLLPAFVLFESLSDPSFKISRLLSMLLFVSSFAVFFSIKAESLTYVTMSVILLFSWYFSLHRKNRYSPYLFLFSLLTIRLITTYGI